MSELGKLLKSLRSNQSIREVSRLTGISHTYLGIIEKGIDPRSGNPIKPSPETLKILSEAYNYPYEKLMQASGYLSESHLIAAEQVQELSPEYQIELENVLSRANLVFQGKGLDETDRNRILEMLTLLFHDTARDSKKQ